MSPARPSLTLNRGDTTVESLGLSAPQGKGETCRRKEGGEEGEFKQACLIDDSVFSSPVRAVFFETVSCNTCSDSCSLYLTVEVFIRTKHMYEMSSILDRYGCRGSESKERAWRGLSFLY